MQKDREDLLIEHAWYARERARTPFSHFMVGAALLSKSGRIYTGCNIENPSLSLSICAERVAIIKAVSEGESQFEMLAVVADTQSITYPCGACRQMIWEFGPGLRVVLANLKGKRESRHIRELLPDAFDFNPKG